MQEIVEQRAGRPWCLFLDRDGVINTRIIDGYVRRWDDFEFVPGALDALRMLARWAPHIVVVTNQQGVGKNLMTAADLDDIHTRMRATVVEAGGRIDAVEACPHLTGDECQCRKPNPGMALRYLAAHPNVDASLSVMVGDTESDVEMGRRLRQTTGGCAVIRVDDREDMLADATFDGLVEFAASVAATPTGAHSAE